MKPKTWDDVSIGDVIEISDYGYLDGERRKVNTKDSYGVYVSCDGKQWIIEDLSCITIIKKGKTNE